jgi:hypothetical protein
MKKNIYLAILTIVTMVCMMVGIFAHVLGGSIGKTILLKNSSAEQAKLNEKLDAFSSVQMNLAAAEVVIQTGSDYMIAYTGAEKLVPDYSVDGDVLKITNGKNHKLFGGISNLGGDCTLTVTVPEDANLTKLSAAIDAGELRIYGIRAETFDVDVDAGNVEVYDGNYAEVTIDVDAGNMTFEKCTMTSTEAENDMGNITLEACAFDSIRATADMGNIEVSSSQPLDGYTIQMSADLGNITVNGKNYSGSYHTDGDSEHSVDITVSLGNAELTY